MALADLRLLASLACFLAYLAGVVIAECGTGPDEVTYACLSLTSIRDARRNWTAENHLYNLTHRGYTAEGPGGHATCCFDFYRNWVNNPEKAKETTELLTRDADKPEEASGSTPLPPPNSALALKTLGKQLNAAVATVNGAKRAKLT